MFLCGVHRGDIFRKNREGKLKKAVFILVVSVMALTLGAQEAGNVNVTENSVANRPTETELFFDDEAGDETEAVQTAQEELPGIGFSDFSRMILVLGFVILLIYGFFWLLKRYSGVRAEGMDAIRILSTRPIKGDTALHLVQTGNRFFLVGSTGSSINLLSEIDDGESIDQIKLESSRSAPPSQGGFIRTLRKKLMSSGIDASQVQNPSSRNQNDDPAEFLRRQTERLRDL